MKEDFLGEGRRRRRRLVVEIDEPGRGLLLKPLACAAGVDPGSLGQLGCERGPAVVQRAIQPEAVA